jgi:hypothetical protein
MEYRESLISAHHNYLLNRMLTPGFCLGDPKSNDGFFFLADLVLPGESTPRISARLFDSSGLFLVELRWNRTGKNPGSCSYQSITGGFRLLSDTGESLIEVHTESFARGYLTRIQGRLYDESGELRMEPTYDGIKVYGEGRLALDTPFDSLTV